MPVVQFKQVTLRYGSTPLLDQADLLIEPGERVCLIGSNGTGKTSLMRLITGQEEANGGEVMISPRTFVTHLDQKIPESLSGSVREIIASGLRDHTRNEDWNAGLLIDGILREARLDGEERFESLSGGLKRRTLLARAMADSPDLLLLDEPTNHLDLESILWLEETLVAKGLTVFSSRMTAPSSKKPRHGLWNSTGADS
ncbi:ATP-binding cassette domain-containing protein [Oscillatoria laete-virens NRMC-F 0139]|nr:ATP-binding cassette domain-containing protein [Oscillatoria laete-virens]MDL5053036.1 ATP-binding cassette domain-containing protein [Oscillatoria laete-virens NRMC-F 0139]